jgi:hypothetical protein
LILRHARVYRELRVFTRKKHDFFFLSFNLLDTNSYLSWDRYKLAKDVSE